MTSNIHEPINLGNSRELTILEFAEIVKKLLKKDLEFDFKPLPTDDPKVRRPDISRAQKELAWEPLMPLEEGLKRTLEYFRLRI
jgi:dTDP-glucose 4,6-dehydratase